MDTTTSVGFLLFVLGVISFAIYQLIVVNQEINEKIKKLDNDIYLLNKRIDGRIEDDNR